MPGRGLLETVILLQPPLPLVGVSIAMERERQQGGSCRAVAFCFSSRITTMFREFLLCRKAKAVH